MRHHLFSNQHPYRASTSRTLPFSSGSVPSATAPHQGRHPCDTHGTVGRAMHTIQLEHADRIARLRAMLSHPRSLARDSASWRAPSLRLPAARADGLPELRATLTRYRAGEDVRSTLALDLSAYRSLRQPAYVVTLRLSDPAGHPVPGWAGEAWVRSLVGDVGMAAVVEVDSVSAHTYCWLVDGSFTPLPAPPSLFIGSPLAA